jgi:hypothetical protein
MYDLDTVAGYLADARVILLDKTPPYRYDDTSLIVALNLAILEARRLRSDLFTYKWHSKVPQYTANNGEPVPIEPQYRLPIVYGLVAHAMLRDEEDVPVERANSFLAKFQGMLTGVNVNPTVAARNTQQQ